jgi:glycosyltransferase involved in cell wall biosynthesis
MMRIAVDATCWSNRRGYGRFTRALMTAVLTLDRENHYTLFTDHDSSEFPFPPGAEEIRIQSRVPTVTAAAADGRRSLKDLWAARRAMDKEKVDLIFFPSIYSFVPLANRAPKLVTVHDTIAELFPKLIFPTWRSKFFWDTKVKWGCAQARLVLTVSEYSRQCLTNVLKIPSSRIRVVSEANDPAFRPLERSVAVARARKLALPGEASFVLYVGGFGPHKNLPLLVDVFRDLQARPEFSNVYLILVGDHKGDVFYSEYRKLADQVKESGLNGRVIFPGHISDADLVAVMSLAKVLVLPSKSEGFGLPAVEAAACGVPVVVTTQSPIPELLGEGAIAVDPDNRAGWLGALAQILSDEGFHERMTSAGLKAAAELSWDNSARQLLSIFEEVRTDHAASS